MFINCGFLVGWGIIHPASMAWRAGQAAGCETPSHGALPPWDTRHQTPDIRHQTPDTIHQTPDTRHQTPDTKHQTPSILHQTPDTRHQTPDTRHKTPFIGGEEYISTKKKFLDFYLKFLSFSGWPRKVRNLVSFAGVSILLAAPIYFRDTYFVR